MDRGRLVEAETVFQAALRRPGPLAVEIRHDLMQLFWQEGRLDEARVLIERTWDEYRRTVGPASDPGDLQPPRPPLARPGGLRHRPRPGQARPRRGRRTGRPPGLAGRANLAVRSGKFDEARRWLDRCLASAPDDPVVWTTALDLAHGYAMTSLWPRKPPGT